MDSKEIIRNLQRPNNTEQYHQISQPKLRMLSTRKQSLNSAQFRNCLDPKIRKSENYHEKFP